MSKIDKQLKYFVKALLKYAEKDEHHFNPGFTTEQIPTIFKGWTELEFNKVHHDAGAGCCIYIGPDSYKINVAHCNELQGKFRDSNRTKWILILTIITISLTAISIAVGVLQRRYDSNQAPHKSTEQPKLNGSIDNKTINNVPVGHIEPEKNKNR